MRTRAAVAMRYTGIGPGGDALADQPVAVALRARCRRAMAPAESFGANRIRLPHVAAREGMATDGIRIGFVPCPQFDRIQLQLVRQRVDRALHGEGADRLARRPHEGIGNAMDCRHPLPDPVGPHRVQVARRKAELLRKVVFVGLGGDALVDERRELPVLIGGDRHPLPGRRAAADEPEHTFARERDADGASGHARGHHAELVVEPQRALAAEPAADERRQQRHVLALQSEHVRQTAGPARRELAGVVHGDAVVGCPDGNRRVRLDGVVVVRGRREGQVHGVRGRPQRRIRIAVNDLGDSPSTSFGVFAWAIAASKDVIAGSAA